jgi:hypothetical protein
MRKMVSIGLLRKPTSESLEAYPSVKVDARMLPSGQLRKRDLT